MALEPLPLTSDDDMPDIFEPLCAVFRRSLKEEGLKYTPERARVLDVIVRGPWQDRGGLFQVDALLDLLRKEERGSSRGQSSSGAIRVSKATVYRTLRHMLDAGIVQRVSLGDGQAGEGEGGHYQLVYGQRSNDLIVRTDTHGVEVIAPSDAPELIALRDRLCRERGLVALGHRFHIFAAAREN